MPGAADLVVRGALAAGASDDPALESGDVAELVDLAGEVVRSEDSNSRAQSLRRGGPGRRHRRR